MPKRKVPADCEDAPENAAFHPVARGPPEVVATDQEGGESRAGAGGRGTTALRLGDRRPLPSPGLQGRSQGTVEGSTKGSHVHIPRKRRQTWARLRHRWPRPGSPSLLLVKQVLISVRLPSPGRGCSQTPGRPLGVWPFRPRGTSECPARRMALPLAPPQCQQSAKLGCSEAALGPVPSHLDSSAPLAPLPSDSQLVPPCLRGSACGTRSGESRGAGFPQCGCPGGGM